VLKLIGIKETAQMLDVSVRTMYSWVYTCRIRHYKIGRLVKFSVSDIEEFVAKNVIEER
jgi:excisionase family DNA binding protein